MKIVGFGDSFITYCNTWYGYTNLIASRFDAEFISFGYAGSGTWDAYFQLENYLKNNPAPDVILFAWSASTRLYHPDIRDLCYTSVVMQPVEPKSEEHRPIYEAANAYYQHLHHITKTDQEHSCFYHWIDTVLVPRYPNTKFIHMWGFPKNYCDWGDTEQMEYLHTFTTAVEIRPALIHLSYLDEWPDDLANETRGNHLSPKMHKILADNIIAAIENYEPKLRTIAL
jgi:hypothetical protein